MSQLEMTGERFIPQLRGQIYYEHVHRYALAARHVRGKNVVDMACGEGYGSAILARSAATVAGIDISEQSVDHARKSYYEPNLRFIVASCEAVPLADASIDVVVSFETIEHVNDYRQMLREIRRILKPDGTLIISSPNKLVYSDLAQYENAFHVSELYYSEFRDALAVHFDRVDMFGQRITAASVISPLGSAEPASAKWFSGGIRSVEEGLPPLQDPVYFVAICNAGEIEDANLSSAFIDADDDLLQDVWVEITRLRQQLNLQLPSAVHHPEPLQIADVLALSPVASEAASDDTGVEITALRAELEQQRLVALELRERVRQLSDERDDMQQARQSAVEAYELAKASLRAQNEQLQREAGATLAAYNELRAELDVAQVERQEAEAMRASRSWRLTAPLRKLARTVAPARHNAES